MAAAGSPVPAPGAGACRRSPPSPTGCSTPACWRVRQAAEQSAAWIDKQLAIARRGLDHLEARADALADGDAETVDLAAIGTACAVAWLGFRHADIDWLAGRPRLAAWYVGFARRPSMAATAPR